MNHHRTGASNGPTEGMNFCAKQVKRAGRGFTKFSHYRLRVLLYAGGVHWPKPIRTADHLNASTLKPEEPRIPRWNRADHDRSTMAILKIGGAFLARQVGNSVVARSLDRLMPTLTMAKGDLIRALPPARQDALLARRASCSRNRGLRPLAAMNHTSSSTTPVGGERTSTLRRTVVPHLSVPMAAWARRHGQTTPASWMRDNHALTALLCLSRLVPTAGRLC